MKKLVLIAMVMISSVATFVSCSKSEDTPVVPVNNDPIVGVWKKTAETVQNGLNGIPTNHFSGCVAYYIYTFGADYSVKISTYTPNTNNTNCIFDGIVNYKWQNNGDATHYYYQIRRIDGTIIDDELECFYNSSKTIRYATYKDGPYYIKSTFTKQ